MFTILGFREFGRFFLVLYWVLKGFVHTGVTRFGEGSLVSLALAKGYMACPLIYPNQVPSTTPCCSFALNWNCFGKKSPFLGTYPYDCIYDFGDS